MAPGAREKRASENRREQEDLIKYLMVEIGAVLGSVWTSPETSNYVPVAGTCSDSAADGKVKWNVAPRSSLGVAQSRPP
jgi:hypothetical protein